MSTRVETNMNYALKALVWASDDDSEPIMFPLVNYCSGYDTETGEGGPTAGSLLLEAIDSYKRQSRHHIG